MADDESHPDDRDEGSHSDDGPLPDDIVARALTLTRRMREAVGDAERAAYREERDGLLAEHGYVPRTREDDAGETLVLYPEEWVENGVVQVDRIDDVDRGVERSLSGVGGDDWAAVEAHNRAVAERVAEEHGDVHGANAHAFADFMGNHYRKRVEAATPAEREEFREEYFPRNAWPTDDQRAAVERSLRLVREVGERTAE